MLLTRREAEEILSWAHGQNPGPWTEHCRVAARAAELIARKCGLDAERAYILGLLHDIGYYAYKDGKGEVSHIYTGYKLMIEQGHEAIAGICLSHSFPGSCRDIKFLTGSDVNWTDEGLAVVNKFLAEAEYSDYDRLVQLCDALGTAQGVVMMEKRLVDVVRRHGVTDFTVEKWDAFFVLKDYFDGKCGINIYNLFYDEIKAGIFG